VAQFLAHPVQWRTTKEVALPKRSKIVQKLASRLNFLHWNNNARSNFLPRDKYTAHIMSVLLTHCA